MSECIILEYSSQVGKVEYFLEPDILEYQKQKHYLEYNCEPDGN